MFVILRLIFDAAAVLSAYIIAYSLKFNQLSSQSLYSFPFGQYKEYLIYIALVYIACFYFSSMYKTRKGFLIEIDELIFGFLSVTTAWAIVIALTFIRGEYIYSRSIIILSWPISFILVSVERYIILKIEMFARSHGYGSKRAVVIGSGALAESVAKRIKSNPSYGIVFEGFIENGESGQNLGGLNSLENIIDNRNIKSVYVSDPSISRKKLEDIAEICDKKDILFGTLPDVFNILTTSPSVEDIEGLPVVHMKKVQLTPFNRFVKRFADILLASLSLIISAVPIILISVIIKLTAPKWPVIFVQKRVGLKGKKFRLYKFRTMVHKAERKTGPILATEDDPRKTRLGKILRATKMDELPQLFNILKGDMSFVGPRPERPVFVRRFKESIPKYMNRHNIKVGLAGLAQMHGGYDLPAEEKIKYDLYYIENWSLLFDVKILIKCMEIAFTQKRQH